MLRATLWMWLALTAIAYPGGAPGAHVFRDEKLGLEYGYPEYLQPPANAVTDDDLRNAAPDEGSKRRMGCMSLAVDARRKTAQEHDTLTIMEIDFACMGKVVDRESMEKVVLGNAGSSLRAFGSVPKVGAPQRYELNGYPAAYLEASVDAPALKAGVSLYSGSVSVLIGQTVVLWQVNSADKSRVRDLLTSPVVFDGKAGMALVPAGVIGR